MAICLFNICGSVWGTVSMATCGAGISSQLWYGENVLEAKRNPNWTCPVCLGICSCSICKTKRGWFPTGNSYRKVVRLGYKSVAHYLIATQRSGANSGDSSSTDSSNELPSTEDVS